MNSIHIEKMKEVDIKEAAQVFMNVFNGEGQSWDESSSLSHIKENYSGDSDFIAKDGDKIVGILIGLPDTSDNTVYLYIDSFAVLKEYRGTGIGKSLWEAAMNYAKEMDYGGIRLLTHPDFKSYEWYKRMGLKESGWREVYIDF